MEASANIGSMYEPMLFSAGMYPGSKGKASEEQPAASKPAAAMKKMSLYLMAVKSYVCKIANSPGRKSQRFAN